MDNNKPIRNLLLADDDPDDCVFFKEALSEIPIEVTLKTVYDGEQLMKLLTENTVELPDVIFLDLNMPRKNGVQCLLELKSNEELKLIPVVVYSTSFEQRIADMLYNNGAHYYICKPPEYLNLRHVIDKAITLLSLSKIQPKKENFVLNRE
jgi:response regulator RpfG family c-di-GMP phosphodiesterase